MKNRKFEKIINCYDLNDKDIRLKYDHSYRVAELQVKYAKLLGFSKEDIEIAKVIGLVHDIGRFEQIKRYKTYMDHVSMDHGTFGAKLLFEDGLIEGICDNKEWYPIIKFAIIAHNQWQFKKCDDERMNMHAMLIRDTDKIDVLYLSGTLKETNLYPDDSKVSEKVKEYFWKHMLVDHRELKTHNDDFVVKFAYPLDINYGVVYKEIKELFEKFYDEIKDNEDILEIYNYVMKCINEGIDKYEGTR